MNLRPLLSTLFVTLTLAAMACDDDKKATPPAPTSTFSVATASASVAPSASATASAPELPPLSPDAFCARVFGGIWADFTKACTEDDKKSDGYKLASCVATMPLRTRVPKWS